MPSMADCAVEADIPPAFDITTVAVPPDTEML